MEKQTEIAVKEFMIRHLGEGVSLSEVQQLVNEEFQLKLSFMEIRILASELDNIDWNATDPRAQERAKAKAKEDAKQAEAAAQVQAGAGLPGETAAPEEMPGTVPPMAPAGNTVVEVSKLARPGVALSGTVKFASGSTAEWFLDQTGRLGLDNLVGEPPSREDQEAFMVELERVVRGGR